MTRKVKETECQKCRKYYETVPTTKWMVECNPVYDEKCHTKYQTDCHSETRCVMLYQTVCTNSYDGYSKQHCQNEVGLFERAVNILFSFKLLTQAKF